MIRLYRELNTWMSDNSQANDASDIKRLFGTYYIPTGFRADMSPIAIQVEIQRLNPTERVLVQE